MISDFRHIPILIVLSVLFVLSLVYLTRQNALSRLAARIPQLTIKLEKLRQENLQLYCVLEEKESSCELLHELKSKTHLHFPRADETYVLSDDS